MKCLSPSLRGHIAALATIVALVCLAQQSRGETLGFTGEGSFTDPLWDEGSFIDANRVQASAGITVNRLRAKVRAVSGHYKLAIYTDDSGNPDALLRESAVVADPEEGWNEFTLATPVTLEAGSHYWFAIWSDSPEAAVYADAGSGLRWGKYPYGEWPNPLTLGSGPADTNYCVYAQSRSASGSLLAARGNSIDIPDGDTTPRAADGTDFGTLNVTGSTQARSFTLYNPGTAALDLTGITITGAHAGDFTLTTSPALTSLAADGGSTSFTITFNPSAAGLREATLHIASSAGVLDFAIRGTGAILDFTPQSLFPASKTGNSSTAEGVAYELGTVFKTDLAGAITHLRVYSVAAETGVHTARVWRNSDSALIGGPYTWTYGGSNGWITLDIPDLTIQADVLYTVVVSTGSGGRHYAYLSNDLSMAGGNGANLSYPATAGVYSTTPGARPTQSFNHSNYLRDVVFVAGGGEPPTTGPVRISEFVADNESGLTDEDGDLSDWIELYNPTAAPINLVGYKLADSSASWTFPAVTIGAQSYLVVFASDKNRTAQGGNLHTNFKLGAGGENLSLRNAANAVIASFNPFPAQRPDVSYGRRSDGVAVYYPTPTPGTANGFSVLGFVPEPDFSVGRGFFSSAQTVTISTAMAGTAIRYTLDGSTPTEVNGLPYTAPLQISSTSTVRARAFRNDYLASGVATHTYVFPSDVLQQSPASAQAYGWPAGPVNGQQFRHGMKPDLVSQYSIPEMTAALQQIPSMSIVTDQANLTDPDTGIYVNPGGDGRTWERPVSIELIHPDGAPGFQEDCGLRIRGGQSRSTSFPKHSFHVNFRSEYGEGKLHFPLFGSDGADEFDTFDLRCEHGYAYADPQGGTYGVEFTAMRDVFCREISAAAGLAATRSRYYHLYLNGQYWGLYQTQERPQEDYGETYLGGIKEDYDVIKATGLPQLTIENSAGNFDAWTALWNGCRTVAGNPSNANYFALMGKDANGAPNASQPVLLDPNALATYMLLHYYCGHSDEPLSVSFNFEKPNNFRAIRLRSQSEPFHFFVHDGESSMYAPEWVNNRANAVNLGSPNRALFGFGNPEWMHEDLLANAEYRMTFADEAQRLLFHEGAFTAGTAQPYWDSLAAQIDQAVIGESIRWGNAPNHNQSTWATKVAQVRSQFFATRSATVVTQLRQRSLFPSVDAPLFSQHGGIVAAGYELGLSSPGQTGAIYYSTDGSDPRGIGGSITGTPFTAPIVIQGLTTVRARFLSSSGEWSAMDSATFSLSQPAGPGDLVVSELHYNAPGPNATEAQQGFTSGNQFEFIEIMNIASEPRDLSAVSINTAVDFSFTSAPPTARILQPGGRLVVVANGAAFNSRLAPGANPVIAGTYSMNFDNAGESIVISGASGEILRFAYSDDPPWPSDADGNGHSLVLNQPFTNPDHGEPTSWRPSARLNGQPGEADATPFTGNPLGDDDGDGLPNLVEYATGQNPSFTFTSEAYTPPGGSEASYGFFRFPRDLNADGFRCFAESSDDLSEWTTSALDYLGSSVGSDGMAIETYRTKQPTSQLGGRFFVRLKVQP